MQDAAGPPLQGEARGPEVRDRRGGAGDHWGGGSGSARAGSAPLPSGPNRTLIRSQVSCASLQAVVNYFVLQTKNALVPFLLDEDYEKVLGG